MIESTARKLVGVVVPFYNEQAALPELLSRLQHVASSLADRYVFEFLFVDDGSSDGSGKLAEALAAEEPRLKVVVLRRNYGQTTALQIGFEQTVGDIVISMDGDLQHFPEDIPRFLEKVEEGYDVVCGWRHQRKEGILRRWPSATANWLLRLVTGLTIHDIGTTFRAYTADVAHELRLLGENHRFVPVFARSIGGRLAEVKIQNVERAAGQSNYGLSRTLNVLIDIVFIGFYVHYLDRPIRLFGRIGLGALVVAAVITVALVEQYVAQGVAVVRERSGWFIVSLVLYVSGIQFVLFGVVSELLVRMYFYPDRSRPNCIRRIVGGPTPPA